MTDIPEFSQKRPHIPNASVQKFVGISTSAVHAGEIRPKSYHALVDPIFQTSTFTFEKMAEVIEYEESHVQGHPIDRFEYGRYGNPTIAAAVRGT